MLIRLSEIIKNDAHFSHKINAIFPVARGMEKLGVWGCIKFEEMVEIE